MVGWWLGRLDGGMVGWLDGEVMVGWNGWMVGWDAWMVGWRDGDGVVEWWNGGMVGWWVGGMVGWNGWNGWMVGWWGDNGRIFTTIRPNVQG